MVLRKVITYWIAVFDAKHGNIVLIKYLPEFAVHTDLHDNVNNETVLIDSPLN
jgi:hypothetical protein